ncbi:MAG: pyridoxamine 5'-phosphate oxidase family protein, partial [Deltaproteobacteria bacterium]|nr:pyridoxamine 5'-phosphate oxidase family protein [Deltaproteobacteria bacterium]
ELLFSYPIRDMDVVLGKFLAAYTVFAAMIAPTAIYHYMLYELGAAEPGAALAGYLGLLLLGAAFISLGLFVSSLTENQIISAVVSLGILMLLWLVGWSASKVGSTLGKLLEYISLVQHFIGFARGVIDINLQNWDRRSVMRRKHSEITSQEEMIKILDSTNIGRMATVGADGYPYITPVNFVFYEGCIYFHCAQRGEKMDNLLRRPKVCFEVDVPLSYLEVRFNGDNLPCQTHQLYQSVIIRGLARVVPDGRLKMEVLNALVAKHEGHKDFILVQEDMPSYIACSVVEIKPEKMTGKADLIQNRPEEFRRDVARRLVERGLPGDVETARLLGFAPGAGQS